MLRLVTPDYNYNSLYLFLVIGELVLPQAAELSINCKRKVSHDASHGPILLER